jgi:hypothetical protein
VRFVAARDRLEFLELGTALLAFVLEDRQVCSSGLCGSWHVAPVARDARGAAGMLSHWMQRRWNRIRPFWGYPGFLAITKSPGPSPARSTAEMPKTSATASNTGPLEPSLPAALAASKNASNSGMR